MTQRFLIDTSALVRFYRGQSGQSWDEAAAAGLVGICEPVRLEFLRAAGARPAFYEADSLLTETFPYFLVPEMIWTLVAQLQRSLADEGRHQGPSATDLLVAATATHHGLTVLHLDSDFEVIARVTQLAVQRID